jgi:SAM-dependent methyltransferase
MVFKKAWRKLNSVTRKNLARFQARKAIRNGMYDGIDRKAMAALREDQDASIFKKYQDRFEHSLIRNAERVYTLGLHEGPKLRILDVGCGFGYFLYGAKHFGHDVVGLDLDDPYLLRVTNLLGLKKVIHRIEPLQPLPELPGPFDRITAFATCFDQAGFDGQWGVKEWIYFLKQLRRFMAPGCIIHFKFNQYVGPGTKSGIGCKVVTPELLELFEGLGGTFDKRFYRLPDAPAAIAKLP